MTEKNISGLTRKEIYEKLIEYIEKKRLENSHLTDNRYINDLRCHKECPKIYAKPGRPEFSISPRKSGQYTNVYVYDYLYNSSGEQIGSYRINYSSIDNFLPIMNSIKKYLELENILYTEFKGSIYIYPDEPYYIDLDDSTLS